MNYLNNMYVRFQTRTRNEKGQTMVEYALILALIAVVCAAAFVTMNGKITTVLGNVGTKLVP